MIRIVIAILAFAISSQAASPEMWMMARRARMVAGPDITTDLWHYWNPAVGGTNDLGSRPQNITLVGGLTNSTDGWNFDAVGKYAWASGPISNGASYSMSVWVKSSNYSQMAANLGGYVLYDRGASVDRDFQLYFAPALVPPRYSVLVFNTSNSIYRADASSAPISNAWIHLSAVITGTEILLYTNGVLDSSGVILGVPNNTYSGNTYFGTVSAAPGQDGGRFQGWVDKIRFYGNAKSALFIKAIYDSEKASKGL